MAQYKNDNNYNEIIIKLLNFVAIIDRIDDTVFKLINFSVRYIPSYQIDHFMIPNFLKLYKKSSDNRKYIEEILLKFSQKRTFFSDYDGKFSELFLLIQENDSNIASQIATMYFKHNDGRYMKLLKEREHAGV